MPISPVSSPKIAGKEALVLPVEAGGLKEIGAVEVGAHAHLHALDEVHEDETRTDEFPAASSTARTSLPARVAAYKTRRIGAVDFRT